MNHSIHLHLPHWPLPNPTTLAPPNPAIVAPVGACPGPLWPFCSHVNPIIIAAVHSFYWPWVLLITLTDTIILYAAHVCQVQGSTLGSYMSGSRFNPWTLNLEPCTIELCGALYCRSKTLTVGVVGGCHRNIVTKQKNLQKQNILEAQAIATG